MTRREKYWTARPPRALDPLPIKVTPGGEITIIDMEFKAGTKAQVRIV